MYPQQKQQTKQAVPPVCVWDAFGTYSCGGSGAKNQAAAQRPAPAFPAAIMEGFSGFGGAAKASNDGVEGFCGCSASHSD